MRVRADDVVQIYHPDFGWEVGRWLQNHGRVLDGYSFTVHID